MKQLTKEEQRITIVDTLIQLLSKGNAHVTFEEAVNDLPAHLRGIQPEGLPYSIWQLVEHIRITQWDILEFSRDPAHVSPAWPDEYWPAETTPATKQDWEHSLEQIKKDRNAFIALIKDPSTDLYTPFPHGDGQHLLREAVLIADHTAYHTGQIILVRRLLKAWK
ncbi:DinB family protein [Chitinophaga pendula]|uniref:DinB family protein n=1 Tax=Chitinophaga TaxID=79328 RepID=UPI000BB059AB|nr:MULTISPECIES: DinB family protein [Chitinophaga]ASZ13640.1 ABC transporter [Chitinophaga sp. MD30]UCJ08735.1 DinB family protein [Chitinophaga pendula]